MLRDSLVLEQQHIHTDGILLPIDRVATAAPVLPVDMMLLLHPYYFPFIICVHPRVLAHKLVVVFVSPIACGQSGTGRRANSGL